MSKFQTLKLVYFAGCPRVEEVRALLKKVGASFVELRQEALPEKHPLRKYASPTVLAGNVIILGSRIDDAGSSACSVDLPNLDELKQRLKALPL